jgi:cytochrome c oxidase assembly protein subunit 15
VPEAAADVSLAEVRYPDAPVEVTKAWWEMGHRYIAGALLLLVFAIFVIAWRGRQEDTPTTFMSALLVIILCQAAFGAWTVTLKLWPQVVTAHLLGGFTTLSLLWLVLLRQGVFSSIHRGLPVPGKHALVALLAVIAQIALGGWVSSNYAALACHDFPSCDGSYTPNIDLAAGFNIFQGVGPSYLGGLMDNEARKAIHWVHRLSAIGVAVIVVSLAWRLMRANRLIASAMVVVLFAQIVLGILNVVWVLPLFNATLHNVGGALLLITLVTVNFAPRLRIRQAMPDA